MSERPITVYETHRRNQANETSKRYCNRHDAGVGTDLCASAESSESAEYASHSRAVPGSNDSSDNQPGNSNSTRRDDAFPANDAAQPVHHFEPERHAIDYIHPGGPAIRRQPHFHGNYSECRVLAGKQSA